MASYRELMNQKYGNSNYRDTSSQSENATMSYREKAVQRYGGQVSKENNKPTPVKIPETSNTYTQQANKYSGIDFSGAEYLNPDEYKALINPKPAQEQEIVKTPELTYGQKIRAAELEKQQAAAIEALKKVQADASKAILPFEVNDVELRRKNTQEHLDAIRNELNEIDPTKVQYLASERVKKTVSAGVKEAAGSTANFVSTIGNIRREAAGKAGTIDTLTGFADTHAYQDKLEREKQRTQKIQDWGDTQSKEAAQSLDEAKQNLSQVGQAGIDVLYNATQLGGDMVLGAINPALAVGALGARSFGSGAREAREAGANVTQQALYGASNAAVEMLTEKLVGGIAKIPGIGGTAGIATDAYGKALADEVTERIIRELAESDLGRTAWRTLLNAGGEGLEEAISAAVNPALKAFYDNWEAAKHSYFDEEGKKKLATEAAYSALIGALLGGASSGVNIISGQNAAQNVFLRGVDNEEAFLRQFRGADAQEYIHTPPATSTSATGQSQELNSQSNEPKAPNLGRYERSEDKYGWNVRGGRSKTDVDAEGDAPFGLRGAPTNGEVDDKSADVGKAEESTVVNTNPAQHTKEEQAVIDKYQDSVDGELLGYVESVRNGTAKNAKPFLLKAVSDRAAKDIKNVTGVDVHGNKVVIEQRMVLHILKDHGENGTTDQSMRDVNDIARIQFVIDNYDSISHGGTSKAYVTNKENGKHGLAQTVVFSKAVNGTYYVVEAVPETSKNTIYVVSAYMTKKPAASPSVNAEALRVTSENAAVKTAGEANTSGSIIAQGADNIKAKPNKDLNENSWIFEGTKPSNDNTQIDSTKNEAASQKLEDDFSLTFSSDEPETSEIPPIEDIPPAPMYEPFKEFGDSKKKFTPEKSPKEIAESAFGGKFEEIGESAKRVYDRKMFYSDEGFVEKVGKQKAYDVAQNLGELRRTVNDFANGHADINKVAEYFNSIKEHPYMRMFRSDRIDYQLSLATEAYSKAVEDGSDVRAQKRFQHTASQAMKMIARRAELADIAIKNQLAVKDSVSKHAPKKKLDGLIGKYASIQLSGPNMFRMIDGFDPNANGAGYAAANAAEDVAYVHAAEKVNGNAFFADIAKNKKAADFIRGKTMTGTKIGDTELNELQAVSFISLYNTLAKSKDADFSGLKGINIPGGKNPVFFDFEAGATPRAQMLKLKNELNSKLSPEAREYQRAMDEMFYYYAPKLIETSNDINGVAISMFEKGHYFPTRYTAKNTEAAAFSLADSLTESEPDGSIGTPGLTKSRSKDAGDYLVLEPASEVVNRYINQASNYIAYAGFAQRLELMNTKTSISPNIAEVLGESFGQPYREWMNEYVEDMQLINSKADLDAEKGFLDYLNKPLSKLRRNLQQGALLFSPTTPMKQGAAYFSSMGILKPSSLIKAWNFNPVKGRGDSAGNVLAEGRKLGGLDPTLNDLLHESDTWLGKLRTQDNGLGKFISWASDTIASRDAKIIDDLYHACVIDVKSDNPDMDAKSAEFKKLVDGKFEQVILQAQSTSERAISPELQRTNNELLKSAAMFRSQQNQELNKLIRSIGEAKAAKGTANEKQAAKTRNQAIAGQITAAFHFSILTAVMNAILHKHDRYEDEEGNADVGKIAMNLIADTASNFAGVAWLGDTAADWLMNKVSGGDYDFYGLQLGPISTIKSIDDSLGWFVDSPTLANAKRVAGNISTLFGVPLNNVYNVLNAITMWALDAVGENPDDYDDVLKFLDKERKKESIEYNDVKYEMTRKESREYKKAKKTTYSEYLDYVLNMDVYKTSGADTQKKINDRIKEYANDYAKDQYLTSKGVEYESTHDKLTSKIVIPGTDKDGFRKPDIQPMGEKDIPKYLAYSAAMSEAKSNKDYNAVDALLAQYSKTLTPSQQRRYEHSDLGVTGLLNAYKAGVKSKDYYSVKESIDKEAEKLDVTNDSNTAILSGLVNANVSKNARDKLANQMISSKGMLAAYNAASDGGYSLSKLPQLWEELIAAGEGSKTNLSQDDLDVMYRNNPGLKYIFEEIWNATQKKLGIITATKN